MKRMISALMIIAIFGSVLVGCASSEPTTSTNKDSGANQSRARGEDPATGERGE